jgi:ABC-2 type transport system permease protein
LPVFVISHASLAIHSQNWWAQVGALATLTILNVAVRERELVELPWLSEPIESPPKRVYPMHAILAVIGFQTVMSGFTAGLTKVPDLSATANVAISYVSAAAITSLVCWMWMWRNGLTILPKLPRLPVLRPICWGLAISCATGFAVTMVARVNSVTPPLAAYAVEGNVAHAPYDRWCLLGMWVIAAPLFEEWVIRGLMYRSLRRTWGIAVSVALSAILFATLHQVAGCISLITLGVMTALATERTNRLWPSIIIHAAYNFMIWTMCVL